MDTEETAAVEQPGAAPDEPTATSTRPEAVAPAPEPSGSMPGALVLIGALAIAALVVMQVLSLIGLNSSQNRIAELQDTLQSLRADVVTVAGDVGEVSGSIDDVDERLDELELSLAATGGGGVSAIGSDDPPATATNQPQAATGVISEITGPEYYSGQTVSYVPGDKARVYMVWAHWCPYCQQDLSMLDTWYAANADSYPNTELVTVTTFMDETRSNPLIPYLDQMQFPFPVIMDESQRLTFDLGNQGSVPYWLFVAPDGEVLGSHSGALGEESVAQVFAQIEAIVADA